MGKNTKNTCKWIFSMVEKEKENKEKQKIEVTKDELIVILRMLEAVKRKLQQTLK